MGVKNGCEEWVNGFEEWVCQKKKDNETCQQRPKTHAKHADHIARRMIGTTTMNTTITYGPVVDLQPPHVVGGQQTFAVVGDQGIRQTTGRNAHAVVAVWG